MNFLAIFVGGGAGSIVRYLLAQYNPALQDSSFPLGTFLANIIACLILGLLIGYQIKNSVSNNVALLLMTGFCGGFSTFSTFSLESYSLIQNGYLSQAFIYISSSLFFGLIALFLGIKLLS